MSPSSTSCHIDWY